jgi:predicted dehydrogenase
MTIGETQELADTVNRYGQVYQAGTQRRSNGTFQFAAHLAQSGMLGKIHTVHASIDKLMSIHRRLPEMPEPSVDVCDWNRWLGPVAWRPFNQAYVNGGWHGYSDFNAGAKLLDWGSHTVDLCQMALGMDGTTPVKFEAEANGETLYAYYENGVKLVMRKYGWEGLGNCPVKFEGDEGWAAVGDGVEMKVHPKSLLKEKNSFIAGRRSHAAHPRNFFDCVKSRAQTICNADVMRSSHIACFAAALSWTLGRELTFDPVKEEFIGDNQANRMRTRAKRAPWHA